MKLPQIPKIALVIAISVIGAGSAAGAGTYYFVNKEKTKQVSEKKETITRLENDLKALQGNLNSNTNTNGNSNANTNANNNTNAAKSTNSSSNNSSKSSGSSSTPAADATAGWQTYTNRDIGYVLKYPQGWTLQETDTWTEDNRHVRYVTIKNEENSASRVSLHWGLARNGTFLYTTDRTGIGAGEITEVSATMPVLGASIKKTKLVSEGKIKELFYAPQTSPSGYIWEASIAPADQSNYGANDLTGVSQIDMMEAILSNITLMF